METRRALRRWLYALVVLILLGLAMRIWVYPAWVRRNALHMAREWIAAGRLNYAADAVQNALKTAPEDPQLWRLAAELAGLNGQRSTEVEYARRATLAEPKNPDYVLEWAAAALRADLAEVAEQALSGISSEVVARSALAQRLLGEVERRKRHLEVAKNHFELALRLAGPGAINEVPLGLCLLSASEAVQRQRGLTLLGSWTADREWGAPALRILLDDAVLHDDRTAMIKWAVALRGNPRCTVGDMPRCLLALSKADTVQYKAELEKLEQAHLANPEAAAQLAGWLNQIGRSADVLAWMQVMPARNIQVPPLAVAKAEALRQVGDWNGLEAFVLPGNWGAEGDFLRWSYVLRAALALGKDSLADEFRRTLYNHASSHGVHALFAGSTLYSWGMIKEAEYLWWRAAEQDGGIRVEALGTLARHYQVQRDAVGEFKVFNRLHALRPGDAAITNNFAFYAALVGNREGAAEELAKSNMEAEPKNRIYVCTYAFTLLQRGQVGAALKLVEPFASRGDRSGPVLFVYGLALAGTGQGEKAAQLLRTINPATLTTREVELIDAALGSR